MIAKTSIILAPKRFIGLQFDDPIVQESQKYWPYKLVKMENGNVGFEINVKSEVKTFTPEEIITLALTNLKQRAEEFLGMEVTDAIMSVSNSSNLHQRYCIKKASEESGKLVVYAFLQKHCLS